MNKTKIYMKPVFVQLKNLNINLLLNKILNYNFIL